jgi:hypothetical protein
VDEILPWSNRWARVRRIVRAVDDSLQAEVIERTDGSFSVELFALAGGFACLTGHSWAGSLDEATALANEGVGGGGRVVEM